MIIYENDNLNDISNNKNSYNEIMGWGIKPCLGGMENFVN